MSNDDALYDYVQTILEDREAPSHDRVATAMDSIEAQVRAEHGLAPHESIGDVPLEWKHRVPPAPRSGETVTPGILVIPESINPGDIHLGNGTGPVTHISLWEAGNPERVIGSWPLDVDDLDEGFTITLPAGPLEIDEPKYDYIEKKPKKERWWHRLADQQADFWTEVWRSGR